MPHMANANGAADCNVVGTISFGLPAFPTEVWFKIFNNIKATSELHNTRLASKALKYFSTERMTHLLVEEHGPLYNRYGTFLSFNRLLDRGVALPQYITSVEVVLNVLKPHKYGYEWAWEDVENKTDVRFTDKDFAIINKSIEDHVVAVADDFHFTYTGGLIGALANVILRLPALTSIKVRMLAPGEHIRGWTDLTAFDKLSCVAKKPVLNNIFYGMYERDALHGLPVQRVDEYGELIEDDAGALKINAFNDFLEGLNAAGRAMKVIIKW